MEYLIHSHCRINKLCSGECNSCKFELNQNVFFSIDVSQLFQALSMKKQKFELLIDLLIEKAFILIISKASPIRRKLVMFSQYCHPRFLLWSVIITSEVEKKQTVHERD